VLDKDTLQLLNVHNMFLIRSSFLFYFILPAFLFSQKKIKIITTNESKLPVGEYKGTIRDNMRWTDDSGEHCVIICETGIYKSNGRTDEEMEGNSADVYAYTFSKKDGKIIQDWKIHDLVRDCPFDITAYFVKNTLQVTDLDNNGKAEIWVMYKVTCRSDVSPCEMKIIMYEGETKHAMRGQTKVPADEKTYWGGDYKFDEAFNAAPKKIKEFAIKLWNDNVVENWGK
jgi:hypothetical protein